MGSRIELQGSFKQYFQRHSFILDNLFMKYSNGHVIRIDGNDKINHLTLLKMVKYELLFYELKMIANDNKEGDTHNE